MIIQKSRTNVGIFLVEARIKGEYFVKVHNTGSKAIDELFAQLKWLNIGNWNKNPKMGKTTSTFGAVSDLIALSK